VHGTIYHGVHRSVQEVRRLSPPIRPTVDLFIFSPDSNRRIAIRTTIASTEYGIATKIIFLYAMRITMRSYVR